MTRLCLNKNKKKCWLEKDGKRISKKYEAPISDGSIGCGKKIGEEQSLRFIRLKLKDTWNIVDRLTGEELFIFKNRYPKNMYFNDSVHLVKLSEFIYYTCAYMTRSYIFNIYGQILYKNVFITDFDSTLDSHIIYVSEEGIAKQITIDKHGKEIYT